MIRWKSAAALALSALVVGSMAGCRQLPQKTNAPAGSAAQQELKPEQGAKLVYRTSSAGQLNFAREAAKNFQKKYGVSVTAEDGSVYDQNKTNLEGASGKGADVFMSPQDKTMDNQRAGLLLKLDSRIASELQKDVSPVAMKTVTVNGGVYGVPVSIETYVMFYNKKLVTGKPAATFEQLLSESKKFNSSKDNKFWFLSHVSEGATIYPMLSVYGFQLFGANGDNNDKPGFDSAEFEKGLEVLAKYRELMPAASGDLANWDFLTNQFVTGKTAYLISGPWNIKTFRDAKVDFGVADLPTYDGRKEHSFAFVQNAQVSAYTKYPIAAQLFARGLVSVESAELLYSKASCITSRSDISQVKGLAQDGQLSGVVTAFRNATPMPTAKRLSCYWTIAANIGPAVFDGKMTPKAGAAKAASDWQAFLKAE
jgi:arabinogalactan oligomer/maltooligosaccharide transport system substrate-binding protein